MDPNKYVSFVEAAEILEDYGIINSIVSLYQYHRAGKLPGVIRRNGTRLFMPNETLQKLLDGALDLSGTFKNWRQLYGKPKNRV